MLEKGEGFWQDLVKLKYVKETPIKQTDSPIWSDLLKIRPIHLKGGTFKVKNEKIVSFWLDPWLDDKPLYFGSKLGLDGV
jgi:hypothetical protein